MSKVLARTVGRRKSAVARVQLESGKGTIHINRREIDDYFSRIAHKRLLLEPLEAAGVVDQYDIQANVRGGGLSGQAGAVQLAIARALEKINEDFRTILKQGGFLTRDAREVERKKYGQPGARKRFQFSKR
ncbi:MAG: 30S ribosomal protein S9 [Fidelibacterota bacterium]|nr:MAG: 30S ribosomal protein S9 [Candidatus Neomarinimicrobiota bacterium]